MEIAYLANVRLPSERAHAAQITHMCQAFAESGANVTLFTNTKVKGDITALGNYFSFTPRFSLKRIKYAFSSSSLRSSFYINELLFAFAFLLFQYSRKYDLVYCRQEWILWILSFFIAIEKLVWESHEAQHTLPARYLLKKGIKTVVISEGIYAEYLKKDYMPSQFLIAHDGIDDSFFGCVEKRNEARARLGLQNNSRIAMYIGGFAALKGVETFFKAAAYSPEVRFVTIGGSEAQVSKYQKQYPNITFLGFQPYSNLKDNQQAADVLIIPNSATKVASAEYTSPLKLFAHMTSKIPLILSDVASLRVVVEPNDAFWFKADDPFSLSQSINEVFKSYDSASEISLRLAKKSKEYTWSSRSLKILNFVCG